MNLASRHLWTALAVVVIAGWATSSFACDKDKASASAAAATSATCTAEMAAKCTPEMAAACKAAKASAVSAVTASSQSCAAAKASAASASSEDHCSGAVKATTASKSKGLRISAANSGACEAKGARFTAAGSGACAGHGMAAMTAMAGHDNCAACLDMVECGDALSAASAHRQVVRLKNGVMYVYTADSPGKVNAVQAAVARRGEHLARFAVSGDRVHLCPECKEMRGAMASGKLTREVINIEGGCLTLVTSTDRSVVARIHAMTEPKTEGRIKS